MFGKKLDLLCVNLSNCFFYTPDRGKLSGGSMNPARAFGAALAFNNGWDVVWVYVGGGVIGAISASVGYRFFFSKRTLRRPFLTVLQSEESDE
jgi:glycerol uptake facilitator-like aquaporin